MIPQHVRPLGCPSQGASLAYPSPPPCSRGGSGHHPGFGVVTPASVLSLSPPMQCVCCGARFQAWPLWFDVTRVCLCLSSPKADLERVWCRVSVGGEPGSPVRRGTEGRRGNEGELVKRLRAGGWPLGLREWCTQLSLVPTRGQGSWSLWPLLRASLF